MSANSHPAPTSITRGMPPPPHRSWSVLVLVAIAQFMVILDMTVVNMALPSIGRALHLPLSGLQWVVTAYVLVTGGLTLLGGRASDLLGRRTLFLTGLTVFTLASLTSGLAPDAWALIVSRAVQGLGAAMLTPAALAIITATYVGAQRATALGIWGAMAGGGAAAGVLVGGAITTWIGWRWIFLINVPIGVMAGAMAPRMIARGGGQRGRLGLPATLFAVAGLVSLVYGITDSPRHGWGTMRTLLPLVTGVLLLGAFALAERVSSAPLIPPGTLRSRPLVSGVLLMLGTTSVMVGVFYLDSLYLQTVPHASAVLAGLEFLPLLVMVGLGTHVTAKFAARTGTRALAVAGLLLMAVSALWLSRSSDYLSGILPGFVVLGSGVGIVFPAASVTVMSDVSTRRAGLASGMLTTGHEVGAALGIAVFTVVAAATAGTTIGGPGFASGYRDALAVAAAVAATLATLAAVALPPVRPAPGTKVAGH